MEHKVRQEGIRGQILAQNTFYCDNLSVVQQMLQVPGVLFLDNTFKVPCRSVGNKLLQMLPKVCTGNKVVMLDGEVLQEGENLAQGIAKCGSPLAYLQDCLHGDSSLPEGAVPHLLATPESCQPVLRKLFHKYKRLFPPTLSSSSPPNRGLGDVHSIPLVEGAKPVYKAMYKHSSKE